VSWEVTKPKVLVQSILLSVSENERYIYIYFYIYHILYTLIIADSSHLQGSRTRGFSYGT